MKNDRNAKYQAALREKRAAAGIVQTQVFVHKSRREEIREIAKRMQEPIRDDSE